MSPPAHPVAGPKCSALFIQTKCIHLENVHDKYKIYSGEVHQDESSIFFSCHGNQRNCFLLNLKAVSYTVKLDI